jgi:hypothetical protein
MTGFEALQALRHRSLNCLIIRKEWKGDKYIEVDCIHGLFVTSEGFDDTQDELIKSLDKHYTSTDVFLNELFFDDWEILDEII